MISKVALFDSIHSAEKKLHIICSMTLAFRKRSLSILGIQSTGFAVHEIIT